MQKISTAYTAVGCCSMFVLRKSRSTWCIIIKSDLRSPKVAPHPRLTPLSDSMLILPHPGPTVDLYPDVLQCSFPRGKPILSHAHRGPELSMNRDDLPI